MQFTLVFIFSISFIYFIILSDEGLVQFTLVFTFSIKFIYFIILCDEELVQFTLVGGGGPMECSPRAQK